MALTEGTTLGPYTVTAKIGEGGMGEVYAATDIRLDHTVAIKVAVGARCVRRSEGCHQKK